MRMSTISSRELDNLIYNGDALIIDLRDRVSYRKQHLQGAINVPYDEWRKYNFPSSQTLVLYCERGANSMVVARELLKQGICAMSLVGGINGYRGRFLTTN